MEMFGLGKNTPHIFCSSCLASPASKDIHFINTYYIILHVRYTTRSIPLIIPSNLVYCSAVLDPHAHQPVSYNQGPRKGFSTLSGSS